MNIRVEIDLNAVWHDYANLFPMLDGAALSALRDDIRAHGVREPVVMHEGKILDGRNRYQCARELGLSFPVVDYDGDDALAYVISTNLHRRHLSESQRASVAAKLANMPLGANQHHRGYANLQTHIEPELSLSERATARPPMTSRADAARMLNVSERSVATARKVHETAPSEIVRAVDDGLISVSLAAKVADLPDDTKASLATQARDAANRADLRRSVLAAVQDTARRPSNRNPHHVPDAKRDRVISFTGDCARIADATDLGALAAFSGHEAFRNQMLQKARDAHRALAHFLNIVETK